MGFLDATALSCFVRRTAESASEFSSVVRNLILDVRESYRPELHYMRGPGPKWCAKHQFWLKFDARALPPAEQHQPSTVYVRDRDAYCAARARIVKRYGSKRLRCGGGGELIAGVLLSIGLLTMPASASALTLNAASPHQYKYCRYLTNGFIRVCEFDSLAQCKATSSRCERYPFLRYCHALNGQIQRCDFDTLAECEAASSGLPGDCERSPFMRDPQAAATVNQKPQESRRKPGAEH